MKLKRSDIYIFANLGDGQKAYRTKGYIFQKNGHWFSVRRNDATNKLYKSSLNNWVISDFVTGLVMTSTDNKLNDVPDALSDNLIDKLIEFYKDCGDIDFNTICQSAFTPDASVDLVAGEAVRQAVLNFNEVLNFQYPNFPHDIQNQLDYTIRRLAEVANLELDMY